MLSTVPPCFDADPWFGSLAAGPRGSLIGAARERRLEHGALVYGAGDAPNGFWAVIEGEVRLKGYPAPGMEFLALAVRPGGWFGEVSTIDGGPRPHDAVAFGVTRLLHVSMASFTRLASETPALYHDLARLVCRRERMALDFVSRFLAMPGHVRLARLLLVLTAVDAPDLHMRQEDLAIMLGVSRQTLNRHLGILAASGAIDRSYGRVRVNDRSWLRDCS